jgi:hypothetical protein
VASRGSYPWYFPALVILGFLPLIALLSAGVALAVTAEGWVSALGWALAGIGAVASIAYGFWTQTRWARILG